MDGAHAPATVRTPALEFFSGWVGFTKTCVGRSEAVVIMGLRVKSKRITAKEHTCATKVGISQRCNSRLSRQPESRTPVRAWQRDRRRLHLRRRRLSQRAQSESSARRAGAHLGSASMADSSQKAAHFEPTGCACPTSTAQNRACPYEARIYQAEYQTCANRLAIALDSERAFKASPAGLPTLHVRRRRLCAICARLGPISPDPCAYAPVQSRRPHARLERAAWDIDPMLHVQLRLARALDCRTTQDTRSAVFTAGVCVLHHTMRTIFTRGTLRKSRTFRDCSRVAFADCEPRENASEVWPIVTTPARSTSTLKTQYYTDFIQEKGKINRYSKV
ncbi:hypothetical protein B0H10DRAFT_1957722 [Mycena sp. CBHHK59/15]|nr:hypothetical protein B0H10DRAFT_1957722 [Mycena sp. CBHHK59/15]